MTLWIISCSGKVKLRCPLYPGGFNRSAQHLLILRGEEVCHGDVTDLVHGSAEGRAVGAMEERPMGGGRRPSARGTRAVSKILASNGGIAPTPRRRAPASSVAVTG